LPIFATSAARFVPFDDTPGIFDNNIFIKLQKNPNDCVLPIDCLLWKDPELNPIGNL
jgi:hypothetical protein